MFTKNILVSITTCALLLALIGQPASTDQSLTSDHYLLHDACTSVLNEQIGWELYASIVYLNMHGYFNKPSVARTGFAKFFKDQSMEEYEHASKFIEYINKRNATVERITVAKSTKADWLSPREALSDAIELEKHVYAKIQHIHSVAEQKCQDAHLTDFLESYYFTEQVDSIQELQTMLTTISVDDPTAASVIEHMEDVRFREAKKSEL